LARGLQDEFENHVICLAHAGPQAAVIERAGAPVHVVGLSHPAQALDGLLAIRRHVREIRPSVLQGWMYHGNLATLAARYALGGNVAVSWNIRQSLDDIRGDKFVTRQFIRVGARLSRLPEAIIYNSSVSASEHEAFGYCHRRREVILNGFEVDAVRPDPARGAGARRRYGIPADSFLFAHLARWHPMKDHSNFVAAATACAAEDEHCRFFLAGRDVASNVARLISHLPHSVRSRFHIHDEVSDPVDVLQAADALVVSSKRAEGFPNVLGEAMMTGTACITTDVGESPNVVGDAGLVVPAANSQALEQAMMRLVNDPALAPRLGRAGRERVERLYDIKAVVSKYQALYRRLIEIGRTS